VADVFSAEVDHAAAELSRSDAATERVVFFQDLHVDIARAQKMRGGDA
jgi:hypothetical protein